MAERMTFPMYAIHRQQTQALWQAVQSLLAERGVMVAGDPPADDPEDLLAHWRQPRLLLSQTCGYPLVTQLPEVQTVGCFHYAAPGCEGRRYRSLLVVREADSHRMLADFFGRRAVCNAEHSQSGYNVLRKMVAPLSREGRFFSAVVFSGSHRRMPCLVSNRISKELLITSNIKMINLDKNKEEWAKEIMNTSITRNGNARQELIDAGYDIVSEAEKLQRWYLNLYDTVSKEN